METIHGTETNDNLFYLLRGIEKALFALNH